MFQWDLPLQIATDSFIHPVHHSSSLNTFPCQYFQVPHNLLPFCFVIQSTKVKQHCLSQRNKRNEHVSQIFIQITPQINQVQIGCTGLEETKKLCLAATVQITLVCPVLKGLRMQVSLEVRDGQKCQCSLVLKQTNSVERQTQDQANTATESLSGAGLQPQPVGSSHPPDIPKGTGSKDSRVTSLFALAQEQFCFADDS